MSRQRASRHERARREAERKRLTERTWLGAKPLPDQTPALPAGMRGFSLLMKENFLPELKTLWGMDYPLLDMLRNRQPEPEGRGAVFSIITDDTMPRDEIRIVNEYSTFRITGITFTAKPRDSNGR